jgi:hypothetical protein
MPTRTTTSCLSAQRGRARMDPDGTLFLNEEKKPMFSSTRFFFLSKKWGKDTQPTSASKYIRFSL